MAHVRYNLEQRLFIYDYYVKTDSYKSCSAWTAIKLLHIRQYKITVVPEIKPEDYEERARFCNWFINCARRTS
jgi:hypothetical protein